MQMLVEAIGMLTIIAGLVVFACACVWSFKTLKANTGSVFNLSMIAGIFVFYNLVVKTGNGDAAFHNYIIGLIALVVVVLDALAVYGQHGGKTALARVLSAVYGALIFAAIAFMLFDSSNRGGKKHED